MVVVKKLISPLNPNFLILVVLAVFCDIAFFYVGIPSLTQFMKSAKIVETTSQRFGLIGVVGFNSLPIMVFLAYVRKNLRHQPVEAFLLCFGIVVSGTPIIFHYPIMRLWASYNHYHLVDRIPGDRALAGATYTFEKDDYSH